MDPLAQLQDIQLPEKIHNYPLAIGWWVLAVICIALIIFISLKIINYKKIRRSQQKAIKEISSNDTLNVTDCVTLLKWAALEYFPRENVANLYGESFYHFLLTSLPIKHQDKFKALSADTFQNMYQKTQSENNNASFQQATKFWLNNALPPKQNKAPTQSIEEAKS